MVVGNNFNVNLDNVYTFAAMMENSAYVITHNSSIYFTLESFDSNFNYMKAQIPVLVPSHTLSAFLILSKFEMKKISAVLSLNHYGLSVLSSIVVTVLFIN